jgi:hypothetical protein
MAHLHPYCKAYIVFYNDDNEIYYMENMMGLRNSSGEVQMYLNQIPPDQRTLTNTLIAETINQLAIQLATTENTIDMNRYVYEKMNIRACIPSKYSKRKLIYFFSPVSSKTFHNFFGGTRDEVDEGRPEMTASRELYEELGFAILNQEYMNFANDIVCTAPYLTYKDVIMYYVHTSSLVGSYQYILNTLEKYNKEPSIDDPTVPAEFISIKWSDGFTGYNVGPFTHKEMKRVHKVNLDLIDSMTGIRKELLTQLRKNKLIQNKLKSKE